MCGSFRLLADSAKEKMTASLDAESFPEKNLSRRLFRNSAALLVGSNLNSLGRLVTAGLVVRGLGSAVFGEYALIVVWLAIAEWILDFGTTEVFVREANQTPERRDHLVRTLIAMKVIQAPLAVMVLLTGFLAMQYSQRIVLAGMLAGVSLFFIAGVAVCRAKFKATLTMEREVAADFISVITMLSFVPLVSHFDWGLMGLMAAYVASRAVFLAGCLVLSPGPHLSIRGVTFRDIRWGIESSSAIGIIGFVVVAYSSTDLLVLSRLAGLSDVAIYSAAQRFTTPLMMALSAIGVSVYPVLALIKSPERFRETCQSALDTIVQLGGFGLVILWCGAEFFMRLLGPDFVPGSDAVRILAVTCVIKALSTVIGPVLFLVRAQSYALGYIVLVLVVKFAVMVSVTPHFGYIGAAVGTLCVEAFILFPVTLYFVRAFSGFTIRWSKLIRVAGVITIVIAFTRAVFPQGNIS